MLDEKEKEKEGTPEEQSEFFLTEEGELKFKEDVQENAEKPSEEQESEKKTEEKEEKEPAFYTKEEIETLGIDKLDPKRIPPDLIPFYKSMQADYTRKTQRLADEKRKLEEASKLIEQEVKLLDIQSRMELPNNVVKECVERAKAELKSRIPDFNEYEPDNSAQIVALAQEYMLQIKQTNMAQKKLQAAEDFLRRTDPDFEKVSQYALYLLENELPYKFVKQIEVAKQVGDPLPILKLYEMAKTKLVEAELATEPRQTQQFVPEEKPVSKKDEEPPKVESAGKTQTEPKKKVDLTNFSKKSMADQVATLIELGLV